MPESYARTLRWSVLLTAPLAAVMVGICAGVGGVKGLVGALLGVALVIIFFGISILAVGRAARISQQAMMITAISVEIVCPAMSGIHSGKSAVSSTSCS